MKMFIKVGVLAILGCCAAQLFGVPLDPLECPIIRPDIPGDAGILDDLAAHVSHAKSEFPFSAPVLLTYYGGSCFVKKEQLTIWQKQAGESADDFMKGMQLAVKGMGLVSTVIPGGLLIADSFSERYERSAIPSGYFSPGFLPRIVHNLTRDDLRTNLMELYRSGGSIVGPVRYGNDKTFRRVFAIYTAVIRSDRNIMPSSVINIDSKAPAAVNKTVDTGTITITASNPRIVNIASCNNNAVTSIDVVDKHVAKPYHLWINSYFVVDPAAETESVVGRRGIFAVGTGTTEAICHTDHGDVPFTITVS